MKELRTETMEINMGPHHPSTHGVYRAILELDGEVIRRVTSHVGYLHRGTEKLAESKTYHQFLPVTDRLDYMNASYANFAYCLAVEKLLGIEVPPRGQYLRVIIGELSRIFSHLFWGGTHAHDMGAVTPIFYMLREREEIMNIFERVSGGRLTPTYFRIGGLAAEPPEDFEHQVRAFIDAFPERVDEYERLLTNNKIYLQRTKGIGVLPKEVAIDWGVSGPVARASGIDWDIRKSNPYSSYDHFEFEVPLGENGDVWDRWIVRIREMRESTKIIRQALDNLPDGPINADAPKVVLPPKEHTLMRIEALIRHFVIIEEGFKPPKGEVYASVESPRGELGYYIISDGSSKPYRLKIRAPSFSNLAVLSEIAKGMLIADFIAILSSLDFILPDVDR